MGGDPQIPYNSSKITNIYQKMDWSGCHLNHSNLTYCACIMTPRTPVMEDHTASVFRAEVSKVQKVAGSREVKAK